MDSDTARAIRQLEQRIARLETKPAPLVLGPTAYVPILSGSTTPGAPIYTTQDGWYERLGPVMLFGGRITWTALGGATGNAQYSLPVAAGTVPSGTGRWVPTIWTNNLTIGAFNAMGLITQASTFFTLHTPVSNGATATIAVEAAGDVIFSGWYII